MPLDLEKIRDYSGGEARAKFYCNVLNVIAQPPGGWRELKGRRELLCARGIGW